MPDAELLPDLDPSTLARTVDEVYRGLLRIWRQRVALSPVTRQTVGTTVAWADRLRLEMLAGHDEFGPLPPAGAWRRGGRWRFRVVDRRP